MNRLKTHLLSISFFIFTLLSTTIFATNTPSPRLNMVDSVHLYATRTTATIPDQVTINITVGNFININEFLFSTQWDVTKLQYVSYDYTPVAALSNASVDLSGLASGKLHFQWSGLPLDLSDGTVVLKLIFKVPTYFPTPAIINFIDDAPTFETIFRNSRNVILPWTGSYGEVKMFPMIACNSRVPGLSCQTAPLLCPSEFPYCSRNDATSVQTSPGSAVCFANDVNNNVWLAFIAGSDSIDFKFKTANCTGQGIQAAVISSNDCMNFSALNPPACNRDIAQGEIAVIECRNLVVGKMYYIMIDGYIGAICDFSIFIEKGKIMGTTLDNASITGVSTACPNQANLTFSIPSQPSATNYEWKIANNSATIVSGSSTPSVNVNWGTVSDSVCVRIKGRCDTSTWLCQGVSIGTRSIRNLNVIKCAKATYFFNNQNLINPGYYPVTCTSSSGCDSTVNLTLSNYLAATKNIDSTVCIGSSVQIGTKIYSVGGTYKDTLVGASYTGCDSIITLNLTVIQSAVSLVKNGDLTCQTTSVTLTGSYNNPSNAIPTFQWTNNATGQVISTTSTANVTQPGTYRFKLTLTLNSISCSQERTISVTKSGSVPSKPELIGVLQACTGRPDLFKVNNPVSGVTYKWSVVGGTFTGDGSSQISINWNANSTSAKICVDGENACGKSDSICQSVYLAHIPDPLSISGDATVCPNSNGTYSVTATPNVQNYQWTVTGGTIMSGQSTATLTVAWGTATTGRVCMTPVNFCGSGTQACFDVQIKNAKPDSLPIVGSVSVCSNDTTVYTNNTTGDVQFAWAVPTGASILRGQGTNTILVVWGSVLGNATIGLTVKNRCDLSRSVTLNVSIRDASLATPVVTGTATICPMSRATYSIPSNTAITAYKWTIPAGATIVGSSTTNSILVDWGTSIGGNVCIEIQNNCNVKKSACFVVEVKTTLDSLPMTGVNQICKDSTATFEVQNDPNATRYLWVVPTGAAIISGLNTSRVVVRFGSSSGYVRVVPLGGCADGQQSRIYVTVKVPPVSPTSINGTTTLCEGTATTFNITPLPEAVSYQWQVPNGARIIGDSTRTQITVNLGTARNGQVCARGINTCGAGFWTCTNITIVTKPTVNAGRDTIVCGNRSTLKGQTGAAVQTWSVVAKPTGSTISFLNPFDAQTDVIVSKSGIYIFKFESSNATGCSNTDSVTIDFKELPGLVVASEDCNLEATEYRVQLSMTGNALPFMVTGSATGILTGTGNGFISNPIPNGTTYNFVVKDNFGCVSNEVRGVRNCPCYTNAGTLRQDPIVACFGATGRAIALNDARLDGNDTYEYILHDGTVSQRGTILKRNKTGLFDASSLQFDRVYYIAYVVGDSLANGSVDLTKRCAATTGGVSIVFRNRLIAGLTGDTTICRNSNASLNFKANQNGIYTVLLRDDVGTRTISNALSGQTFSVSPLVSTTYRLMQVKDKDGCAAELTDSARVNLKPLPISNAGIDRSVCQINTVLDAAENLQYTGRWSTLNGNIRILTPSDPKSAVNNLQNGRNVFIWTVADTSCLNYNVRDTVQIFLPLLPKANTLSLITTVGKAVTGSVSENAPSGTYTITQLTSPTSGTFDVFSNGSFIYRPDTSFTGIVKFKFAVCSDLCTRLCDTGEVRILINPKPKDSVVTLPLDIPNTITPNGDGKNDVLKIDGIERYPNNELVIFNRWGDILYRAKPYLNDWQGVNQNGAELAEGTYYYVLRLNVNDGKILTGNMTILR